MSWVPYQNRLIADGFYSVKKQKCSVPRLGGSNFFFTKASKAVSEIHGRRNTSDWGNKLILLVTKVKLFSNALL
jgi:hypothetical protein